jgi:hypothetical protein
MSADAYNFPYWTCSSCAHVVASPTDRDAPSRCENCGDPDICGFPTLDDADLYSQEVLGDG